MCSPSAYKTQTGAIPSFTRYWLPVMLWMGLIFSVSADTQSFHHSSIYFEPLMRWLFPHLSQMQVETLHHAFRKGCHMAEYALLAWLIWRALRKPVKNDRRPWSWTEAGLALAIVFLYAASDELHQVFVPLRTAQVSDVMIDTSGGATALLLLWLWNSGAVLVWLRLQKRISSTPEK